MKNVKRFTQEKYQGYAHGDPEGAALVIIDLTEKYIERVAICLQDAGIFLAPAMKRALLKDIVEEIEEL